MCGINGLISLKNKRIQRIVDKLNFMNKLIIHRGPDNQNIWVSKDESIGLGHTRLSIIDLNDSGNQPMETEDFVLIFNGEIYNYKELKDKYLNNWVFNSSSDTEVILAMYNIFGKDCVKYFVGMFSFVLYDKRNNNIFAARDHIGIKPFFYTVQDDILYFSSEIKSLLPFIDKISEDYDGLAEYFTFQYQITNKTMFKDIYQLMPANILTIENNNINFVKYWEIDYTNKIDEKISEIKNIIDDSFLIHLNSDVPISSYISGGLDSSIVATASSKIKKINYLFNGRFSEHPDCDESQYAELVSKKIDSEIIYVDINEDDFLENINKIIYHLEIPIAGPGSFPQFMVSKKASEYTKVILGGQGGDEIFGGYVRYFIPYLEKCIHNSINGNSNELLGLSQNMEILKEYKPMIKKYFSKNLFGKIDERYFDIIDRTDDYDGLVNCDILNKEKIYKKYLENINNSKIPNDDFFNKMLHFDLCYSLPALLHVEDRVSMAWSIESRVPLINPNIVEYMAKIPENYKIDSGNMKKILKEYYGDILPSEILNRKDKMGFPVPLNTWFKNKLKPFFKECMRKLIDRNLNYLNINDSIFSEIETTEKFSRKYWVLLNIELWYENFFDNHTKFE